jgi:hypothetical protein
MKITSESYYYEPEPETSLLEWFGVEVAQEEIQDRGFNTVQEWEVWKKRYLAELHAGI